MKAMFIYFGWIMPLFWITVFLPFSITIIFLLFWAFALSLKTFHISCYRLFSVGPENCKEPEILLFQQAHELAYHNFVDADKRRKSPSQQPEHQHLLTLVTEAPVKHRNCAEGRVTCTHGVGCIIGEEISAQGTQIFYNGQEAALCSWGRHCIYLL